jgi:hypothetical protein
MFKLNAATRLLASRDPHNYPHLLDLIATWDAFVENAKPNRNKAASRFGEATKNVSDEELQRINSKVADMDDDTLWHAISAIEGGSAPEDGGLTKGDMTIIWRMKHKQDKVE